MTLFISDTHLGNHRSRADLLCEFLETQTDKSVLIALGDIIDDHQLGRWPQEHIKALNILLSYNKIIYIPGNHDYFMRNFFGLWNKNILVTNQWVHMVGGKKYLIIHGDQHDPWVKHTGFISQSLIAKMGRWTFDHLHTKFVGFTGFRNRCLNDAKKQGFDGVICGHSHNPDMINVDGIDYINTGSWVEELCTAVIEKDGVFSLYETGTQTETIVPGILRTR